MGNRYGKLRHERGALLSLLLGGDGRRPPDSGGCVCAGLPAAPEALMYGLMQLQEKIQQDARHNS